MSKPLVARLGVLALLIAGVVISTGDSVGTCSCGGGPVCGIVLPGRAAAPDDSVVFIGTATSARFPSTRFSVERVLVGPPATELTIGPRSQPVVEGAPRVTSSCDIGFSENSRYLVYAWRTPAGDLMTSLCSRTRLACDPQAMADVAYYEARAAGRSTAGRLSGVVEERHYDSSRDADGQVREWVTRPLAGVRVTATSPEGAAHSTRTDANGLYVFEGLTPSQNPPWRIKADLPEPFAPHDGTVSMRFNGPRPVVTWFKNSECAEANVHARVDGRIAGRLFDEAGRPARRVVIELANATALTTDESASADEKTFTDDDGRFEFRALPEGRYYVGVEFDERGNQGTLDRRRYYPGVRSLKEARVIELRRGQRLRLESFRLPPLPQTRTLTVVVRAPSPEIAAQTAVFMMGAVKDRLDLRSGSTSVRLPYGATYALSAQPPQGYFVTTEQRPYFGPTSVIGLSPDQADRTVTFTLQPIRP